MPRTRTISAHPRHLQVLHTAVNRGDAGTIDALRKAMRVLEAIEKALDPQQTHADIEWVDPAVVRSRAEWEAAQALRTPDGRPTVSPKAHWDPDARCVLELSEDEFAYARSCFDRLVGRCVGADARPMLAVLQALEDAKTNAG